MACLNKKGFLFFPRIFSKVTQFSRALIKIRVLLVIIGLVQVKCRVAWQLYEICGNPDFFQDGVNKMWHILA